MTLTEFLLARIAEDEAVASAALAAYDSPGGISAQWWTKAELAGRELDAEDIGHIVRHDPARVLAECEAKRRIVELHEPFVPYSGPSKCVACADNLDADHDGAPMVAWPCPTVRALASVYAEHPDYDEAWRP